jgi:hypothetical protein
MPHGVYLEDTRLKKQVHRLCQQILTRFKLQDFHSQNASFVSQLSCCNDRNYIRFYKNSAFIPISITIDVFKLMY